MLLSQGGLSQPPPVLVRLSEGEKDPISRVTRLFHIPRFLLMDVAAAVLITTASASLTQAAQSGPNTSTVTALINSAEPGVRDAKGWATDVLDTLNHHRISPSAENVCAVIAIIDQESSFSTNPIVPELGKRAQRALDARLNGWTIFGTMLRKFLKRNPSSKASFWNRIGQARTERDLDEAYRDVVSTLADEWGLAEAVATKFRADLVENHNEIRTIGSMQVAVDFAFDVEQSKQKDSLRLEQVYEIRDQLYTRKGGLRYGILQLLGYETGYRQKLFRFADYNAGRYASRDAAFQKTLGDMTGRKLALDGDLLFFGQHGVASRIVSQTEETAREVSRLYRLGLSDQQIRQDFLLSRSKSFVRTRTFRQIRRAYFEYTGKEPPFAILPEIELRSIKLNRKMTTASFARNVERRYRNCMSRVPRLLYGDPLTN